MGSRIVIIYIVFCIVFFMAVDKQKLYFSTMNHSMPTFQYLAEFSNDKNLFDKKELIKYVKYFEKVAKYIPDYANAFNFLGYCYYYLGETDKAVQSYNKAIELDPSIIWFYYNLGLIHYREGRYSQASECLKNVVRVPMDPNYEFISGSREYRLLLREKKLPEIDIGKQALLRFSQSYLLLILSEQKLKKYDQVYGIAVKAINPYFSYQDLFFYYSGLAAYHQKELPLALVSLKKAVQLNPKFPEAHYLLGRGLELIGESEESKMHIQKGTILKTRVPSPLDIEDQLEVALY